MCDVRGLDQTVLEPARGEFSFYRTFIELSFYLFGFSFIELVVSGVTCA